MAGENEFNDLLDMSLIDSSILDQGEIPIKESPQIEQDTKIDNTVDDESQENVGEQEVEKDLVEKEQNSDSPANSENVFKPLAEFLKEQGFFSTLEKEITNEDELAEAFRAEIKKNEFASLNPNQKMYLEALENGVPDEVFHGHVKTMDILNNITDDMLEDENVRKQIIIQDLTTSGIPEDRAEKQYKRMLDLGESYEESVASRENLIKKQEQWYNEKVQQEQEARIQKEKLAEKQLEDLKNAVYNQEKLFDTFKVDVGLKNKVYETMTKPVDYMPDGTPINKLMKHRLENPIDFDTKLYYLYNLTDGFKDISKFVTKATTTAGKRLRDAVQGSTLTRTGGDVNYGNDLNENISPIVDINL